MGVSPAYSIHEYRPDIYKVVAFKGRRDPDAVYVRDPAEQKHYDFKLDCNYSRARNMVLQYALCNHWDWFFTGTLDKEKYNRHDLDRFSKDLTQFIRDKRKVYGTQVQYLLIPEHHADGAWHTSVSKPSRLASCRATAGEQRRRRSDLDSIFSSRKLA